MSIYTNPTSSSSSTFSASQLLRAHQSDTWAQVKRQRKQDRFDLIAFTLVTLAFIIFVVAFVHFILAEPSTALAAMLPVFFSTTTPTKRTITKRDGSSMELTNWVTFDLRAITAVLSVDEGTQIHLRDGTEFVVMMRDDELKYVMATKAGLPFVSYDYRTEGAAVKNFDPAAYTTKHLLAGPDTPPAPEVPAPAEAAPPLFATTGPAGPAGANAA
jgi:hypothetical protein